MESSTTKKEVNKISIGPEKGYLVLSGGAVGWEWDSAIWDKPTIATFIKLIGSKEKKIIVITTAGDDESQNETFYYNIKKSFVGAGIKNLEILHTRDTAVANSQTFLNKIKEAGGVWFTGGKPLRLTDAFLHTKVVDELNQLLNRGGVIGGNSAGAAVMGSYFLKYNDSNNLLPMDGRNNRGFRILDNSIIIPHSGSNRQFDFFEFSRKYPELLGIGINDGASIIVHDNELEVIGNSNITIYDGTFQVENRQVIRLRKKSERFYFLFVGAKYDLANKRVIRFSKQ